MTALRKHNRLPRKSAGPGVVTIEALKSLRASGPESFEELVASLLSELAEAPFRLFRAGLQPGMDARSPGHVGVEVKRYEDQVPIRTLKGALSDAASKDLGLHLWVAVSTASIGGAGHSELVDLGSRLGVAVLILDADYAQPLLPVGVPPVAALCAINPDAVLYAIENWKDTKKKKEVNSENVLKDLTAIRALPGLNASLERLRKELSEPLWPLFVKRQNRKLADQIRNNSSTLFRVPYKQSRSVRRNVEDSIESWVSQAVGPAPGLAAVIGERFDGKTWCVLDWLADRLESLSLPVFFVSSLLADGSESLEKIILEQITQVLGSFGRHAPEFLRQVRNQPPERGPWGLIVLDGLDEYRFHDPDQHLIWALESQAKTPPEEKVMGRPALSRNEEHTDLAKEDIRPCAVLCTCRSPFWRRIENRIEGMAQNRISVLRIGPYDDVEFAQALKIENQSPDVVAGLPAAVQEMVRRPRYLRLLIDNLHQLKRYDEVTEDLLYWFDAQDQIRRNRPGTRDWDEIAYQGVLRGLARRLTEEGGLGRIEVRSILGQATENISAALQDLQSEGVLETMPDGKYRVRPEQLRVGMGLHLLDLLEQARWKGKDLALELRDAMEPIPDSDPKVEWLRWAAIISLYQDSTPPEVTDTLISTWLRSRNLPQGDVQEVKRLSSRLLRPLLRLAPDSWSWADRNERIQEISRLVIMENLESERDLVGKFAREWMRLVPTRGPYFIEDEPDADERIFSALADPSLAVWELRRCGDSGILWLQGFGLSIESLSPGLIGPEDLLVLMAVRHIPMYHFNSFVDSEDLLFRRRLTDVPRSWFEEKARDAVAHPGTLRSRVIYHFLLAADRADLILLAESIAPPDESAREVEETEPPLETDPFNFLRLHNLDALDPSFPSPSGAKLVSLRAAWKTRLADAKLSDDPSLQTRSEDLDFEHTLASIAAWAPDLGAELVREQMRDLPARVSEGRYLWALEIERHAVLAEGKVRAPLVAVTRQEPEGHETGIAIGHALVSLMPAMSSSDVLAAVLDHHIGFEWRDLFDVASELRTGALKEHLVKRIEAEHASKRLARSYYLLGQMAIKDLSPAQSQKIIYSVEHGEGDERTGALAVAAEAHIFNIPTEVLLPIVVGSDRKTLAPFYAGWILAQKAEAVDQLPVRLRAIAAARHRRFREPFLREVETALEIRKGGGDAVGIRNEHRSTWRSEEFPRSLINGLSEARFRRWAEAVQDDASKTRFWWTGLLLPLFRRALVQGDSLVELLWLLAYPFQRERFAGSTRFLSGYVDWVLRDLHHPEADDQTAKLLLQNLILDCRSDKELFEIALGARYEGQSRIETVSKSLLSSREPEARVRAARLLGWLEGSEARLGELATSDPSLWVRRIAKNALEVRQREGFSHHWLEVFLSGESREARWGAGQLFLESVDAGGMIWARRYLRNAKVDARTYGEALLLFRSASQDVKKRTEAWGKAFLGYDVSDLERIWAPWRRDRIVWEDLK